jgi:SAM-dependent methyltransferase
MTKDRHRLRYRLLRRYALRSRKVQWRLRRLERAVGRWTGALLDGALRDSEKQALSIDLYDASFDPRNDHVGLYAWEMQWFERRLPSPPASILVGAAGGGREAEALEGLGYEVHAFEPSRRAYERCKSVLGERRVHQASFEDLVKSTLHGKPSRLELPNDTRFDAVLLGWGSFGHVLDRGERFELLRACDRIAPEGPILLSIFDPPGEAEWGAPVYTPWGGFLVRPSVEELEEHAGELERRLIVSLQSASEYATLLPSS